MKIDKEARLSLVDKEPDMRTYALLRQIDRRVCVNQRIAGADTKVKHLTDKCVIKFLLNLTGQITLQSTLVRQHNKKVCRGPGNIFS